MCECVLSVLVCVGWTSRGRVHTVSTQMLSESIVHKCLMKLLKSSSYEESLERFAMFMTAMGKDLDKEEAKVCVVSNS